ncbi:MAG: hypothetical protein HRU19_16500 [Pseudobacteriovorax sp.]|nr:hypothetical protein [Pseudobacteriovorax sp.]
MTKNNTLFKKIFRPLIISVIVVLLVSFIIVAFAINHNYKNQFIESFEGSVNQFVSNIHLDLITGSSFSLKSKCRAFAAEKDIIRVHVISWDGNVICDLGFDEPKLDSFILNRNIYFDEEKKELAGKSIIALSSNSLTRIRYQLSGVFLGTVLVVISLLYFIVSSKILLITKPLQSISDQLVDFDSFMRSETVLKSQHHLPEEVDGLLKNRRVLKFNIKLTINAKIWT